MKRVQAIFIAASLMVASSTFSNAIDASAQTDKATTSTTIMEKTKVSPTAVKSHFGKTKDGRDVDLITLRNANGLEARIITYGATLVGMDVPDKNGVMGNIVLGFDNVKDYEEKSPYFGATVGRVANRIAGGSFELDGKTFKLAINNGPNTLHGGLKGFDKKVWEVRHLDTQNDRAAVSLHMVSPDMEENFPGNLDVNLTIELSADNELNFAYMATTDKDTPVNLTNHSYFNLSGPGQGTILDHELTLNCPSYTPVDKNLIPTGEIKSVKGTPFDFTTPHKIGERIAQVEGGYDHNFVASEDCASAVTAIARVEDPKSGRILEALSLEPGVQFYTGNFLDGTINGIGGTYLKNGGFCLETQKFPDALHHKNFPSIIVQPGQFPDCYNTMTIYRFSVKK